MNHFKYQDITVGIFNEDLDRTKLISISTNQGGKEFLFKGADLKEKKELSEFFWNTDDYTFKIPTRIADILFKAIYQTLSEEGYKPENEHKVHGILEAQTKHLEDMRNLVFKNKGE